jgi:DNA topoisomerase VI subunit B
MIISNPNSPTMSHGALKTYAVDISKGAGRFVVFDTLIDGLYRNKVRIVVQEYSSNARDANIEAGIPDTPIEVQLPTSDIPKFAVRDFGLGISPDRMADVFCNLGESTKRDGNAQTGGFGLGAKCGYAYAKMSTGKFRIITVFGNTKYSYVAYINDGAPYIDLVDEEATTERSGTTIIT